MLNKNNKMFFRLICIILSALLLVATVDTNCCLKVYAENEEIEETEAEEETPKEAFLINSEKDWMTFSDNCRLDEWSRGRIINLNADIDLSDEQCEGFYGISSFSGSFYGNGHTIKGLNLSEGTEAIGLFRYLEEKGMIVDLNVEGVVSSTNSSNRLGGIVGVNGGSVQKCSFKGEISGRGTTGGIVGYNGANGTITRCTSEGFIKSSHSVGGIAGENRGVISLCENRADVNSDSSWFEDVDKSGNTSFTIDSMVNAGKEIIASGTDIGGVAGYSDGVIAGCKNTATVGYLHTGKNVGGIAGRQCGSIINCTNNGAVYGKQDIGGIVGQDEPITIREEAKLLSEAVSELHDDIQIMINDMDEMSTVITGDINDMTNHAETAAKTAEAVTDELRDVIEKNIEVVNDLAGRLDYVSDHLPGVLNYLDEAFKQMENIGKDLENIANDLDILGQAEGDSYDPAEHRRLTLLSGTGGSISADSSAPEEGATVNVSISVDTGYSFSKLTYAVYGGEETDVTAAVSGNTYSFTMPAENVIVKAYFSYLGEYVATSTPGGRVTIDDTNDPVIIKAVADNDYELSSLTVAGTELTFSLVDGKYEASVAKVVSENPIIVRGTFSYVGAAPSVPEDVSGNDYDIAVKTYTGNGGVLIASKSSTKVGEEITFAATGEARYCLKTLLVNGVDVTSEVTNGSYKYTVPEGSADTIIATAEFSPVLFVLKGAPGGSATYVANSEKVVVTVQCDSGCTLNEPLDLKDSDGSEILYEKMYADTNIFSFDVTQNMKNGGYAVLNLSFTQSSSATNVREALDRIKENTEILNESMDRINDLNEKINEILTDENGDTKDITDLTPEEEKELRNLLSDLSKEMVKAGKAMSEIMEDVNIVYEIMSPYVEEAMKALQADIKSMSEHFTALSEALQGGNNEVRSIVEYLNALDDLEFVNFSKEFDKNTEKLSTELNTIISIMRKLNNDAGHYTDLLTDDMNRVNDQLEVVFNLLIERVNNLENLAAGDDVIDDHSADEDSKYESSRISNCLNYSKVNGDVNVGGIVGTISREGKEESGDGDGDESTKASFGSKYIASAKVESCTNKGFITVKTENGGGICGSMSLGLAKECTGSGSVSSENASVIGGIAGLSKGTIDGCNSLAELSGVDYLGGIAGKATYIKNCKSMAYISGGENIIGAISGAYLPSDDETDDITGYRKNLRENYKNNYYVSQVLYGIDDVSYASAAEPVNYRDLIRMDGAAKDFSNLEAVFLDEDENVVSRQNINFGDSIASLKYPTLVAEDGDYYEWTGIMSDTFAGNLILRAKSTSNVVVLEGNKNVTGQSLGYAEGTFTTKAVLDIKEVEVEKSELPSGISNDAAFVCYSVELYASGLTDKSETKVRLLSPGSGETKVYVKDGDKWKKTETKDAGKYVQITVNGTKGTYLVVTQPEKKINYIPIIAGAVAGAAIVLIVILLLKHMKKKKKNKPIPAESVKEE